MFVERERERGNHIQKGIKNKNLYALDWYII
jgi:hypothetical protein